MRRVRKPVTEPKTVKVGNIVANVTRFFRIKPCDGCKKRQEALNRLQLRIK